MKVEYFDKINKLREYYDGDQESMRIFDSAEEMIKVQENFAAIKENYAIQSLITKAQKLVSGINLVLINKERISEEDRFTLLRERKIHEFYISSLSGDKIEQTLQSKSDMIDREFAKLFPDVDKNP